MYSVDRQIDSRMRIGKDKRELRSGWGNPPVANGKHGEICNREKHSWIYERLPERQRVLLITNTPSEPWNIIIDL